MGLEVWLLARACLKGTTGSVPMCLFGGTPCAGCCRPQERGHAAWDTVSLCPSVSTPPPVMVKLPTFPGPSLSWPVLV